MREQLKMGIACSLASGGITCTQASNILIALR
jgi:hypothetical protein